MKPSVKKFVSLVVALALCFSMATTAYARSSLYLDSYRAWLDADSNGEISVCVQVQATDDMDEVGASRIQLLESQDGGKTWETVRIYVKSLYPEMIDTNISYYYDVAVTYTGTPGYNYYAIVTVYAGDSTGSDSRNYVTPVI